MTPTSARPGPDYTRRHLLWGWWSILVFLSVGLGLEWLHASKAPWYLNVGASQRRLLLTLAHAHGVLVGLGHIAFALSVAHLEIDPGSRRVSAASAGLIAAGWLIPLGFAVGALPGGWTASLAITPLGGLSLLAATALIATSAHR